VINFCSNIDTSIKLQSISSCLYLSRSVCGGIKDWEEACSPTGKVSGICLVLSEFPVTGCECLVIGTSV
jgi:hypothetical protein